MDLYEPAAEKSVHRIVLLIHGGGWVGGHRSQMSEIGRSLAKAGFLAASTDYTLANAAAWPTELRDVQAAVRYLRSHASELKADPKWIGAAGVSAGGHLSLWLGSVDKPIGGVSSRVQTVVSISGIHDLNSPLTAAGEQYGIVPALMHEKGRPDRSARRQASPIEAASKATAPTFFVQGKADPLVPASQSEDAAKRLTALGVENRVLMVEGMRHGLNLFAPPEQAAMDEIVTWLKGHLGPVR
ncbi:lipase/esterase, putative [Fimbriimonas ginsengisoli Gsoil 348]|uniref:Lipase/esterase, putative n=2 Tax=Fimbriimonas ginsengisoli TaxID=1005039 RepID=A0A068NYS8_FIMGI|nr:lipase/esterase, putative [Fimbriimonas ginsengisoli Gsoil 348]